MFLESMQIAVHHRVSPDELTSNKKEVLRYLGYSKKDLLENEIIDFSTDRLVDSCMAEMKSVLKCQGVYSIFDLNIEGKKISFADISFESESLSINLKSCTKIVLLAATIGPAADFLIKKATKLDTAKAAVMNSCGAMFIEEYVNLLNDKISKDAFSQGFKSKTRFSPGYGDVPLSIQKEFFRLLPCTQRLGLTLMESLIMAPEKSVTAFVGLKRN